MSVCRLNLYIYQQKHTRKVNRSNHIQLQPTLQIIHKVGYRLKPHIIQPQTSRFLDLNMRHLKRHGPLTFPHILQLDKTLPNHLMLFVLLLKIPTLDLKRPKQAVCSNQAT